MTNHSTKTPASQPFKCIIETTIIYFNCNYKNMFKCKTFSKKTSHESIAFGTPTMTSLYKSEQDDFRKTSNGPLPLFLFHSVLNGPPVCIGPIGRHDNQRSTKYGPMIATHAVAHTPRVDHRPQFESLTATESDSPNCQINSQPSDRSTPSGRSRHSSIVQMSR
jgi:hypothetical protein